MYKIHTEIGRQFVDSVDNTVSEDLAYRMVSYVKTNLEYFEKHYASKNMVDPYKHVVVYAKNSIGKIVGFRYYLHIPGNQFCHLFAIFVDSEYRRKGIAKELIYESFKQAISEGCKEFEIRLTEPTEEKDALFNLYTKYAEKNRELKFVIYYWTKMVKLGYG